MLPLIKIRATYLKRHKGKVIMSYCFIPIIVISLAAYFTVRKSSDGDIIINDKQNFTYNYNSEYYLFKDSNFTNIYFYLSNTSLVVNDENIGKKLVEYIEEQAKIKLNLYKDESELNNNSQNIVILDYNENKDSFKFTYKEKQISQTNLSHYFPFKSELLSTQNALDIFNYEYNYKYRTTDEINKIFLTYQAFFAKFLIEKIKGKKINRDIHFSLGFNSYPRAVKNPSNLTSLEPVLSFLITMQFTFVFISFCIQMLEEKEQKLEKLLERQGIVFSKYLGSWFINFFIVAILTNVAIFFGGFQIIKCLRGLFVLDIIFV